MGQVAKGLSIFVYNGLGLDLTQVFYRDKIRLISTINQDRNGYVSFDPEYLYQTFTDLTPGGFYLIDTSDAIFIPDAQTKHCETPQPDTAFPLGLSMFVYAGDDIVLTNQVWKNNIEVIFAPEEDGYISFDPDQAYNTLETLIRGRFYTIFVKTAFTLNGVQFLPCAAEYAKETQIVKFGASSEIEPFYESDLQKFRLSDAVRNALNYNPSTNEVYRVELDDKVFYEDTKTFSLNYPIYELIAVSVQNADREKSVLNPNIPIEEFTFTNGGYTITNQEPSTVFMEGDQLFVWLKTSTNASPPPPPVVFEPQPVGDGKYSFHFLYSRTGLDFKNWVATQANMKVDTLFVGESSIYQDLNHNALDAAKLTSKIQSFADNSTDLVLLDWETEVYFDLGRQDAAKFNYAEDQFYQASIVAQNADPTLQFGWYNIPFKFNYSSQNTTSNLPAGRHDRIINACDYFQNSLYIFYADEQNWTLFGKKGHEGALEMLRQNLDVGLAMKLRTGKKYLPIMWHVIHPNNTIYGEYLIQPDVFADYVQFVNNYRYQGVGVDGISFWDGSARVSNNKGGLGGWCPKLSTDAAYDARLIEIFTAVQAALAPATI